ncbi:MAG: TVP38/TMEM64 family protein [Rickettsiaceae bacterium]
MVGLSIPGATFMTVIGEFFWGQWVGVVMAVFSATLGGSIVFLSAKMASSDLLSKKTDGLVKKMRKGFSKNAFSYLLTLRFIPIVPFVAVNMVAAFFQIPLRTFFLGTFFGIIPGSFVYASIGVALREVIQKPDLSINMLFDLRILLAFTGLGILSLTPIVYQYLKKNRS